MGKRTMVHTYPTTAALKRKLGHLEQLVDRDGNVWTVIPESPFVEFEGERYARAWVEERVGPLQPVSARSNPVDPGPYHVSVLAPKLKLWPRHRDVVVFDEPSQSHALVRVHDLKVDPQIMLVGMKVVLQSEDRQGRWVSLVEYEYEGCRKGWKSTLLK